jgi:hypothetical protein
MQLHIQGVKIFENLTDWFLSFLEHKKNNVLKNGNNIENNMCNLFENVAQVYYYYYFF